MRDLPRFHIQANTLEKILNKKAQDTGIPPPTKGITVYHNPHFLDLSFTYKDIAEKVKAHISDLEEVAIVNTDSLDTAFRQTNNIDKPWFDNEDVQVIKKSRSTSVGDVMELNDELYVVAPVGFEKIK